MFDDLSKKPASLDDLHIHAMHLGCILEGLDEIVNAYDFGRQAGTMNSVIAAAYGIVRAIEDGLDETSAIRRALTRGSTPRERADIAAEALGVDPPSELFNGDTFADEGLHFAAEHGVSLDYIYLGDVATLIREVSNKRKKEEREPA